MEAQLGIAQLTKQASLFLKEKIKAARLAFTDATPIQLLTEEATSSEEWGPETKLMAEIADAAHRAEDCDKIMQVLRQRLDDSGGKNWRQLNKTLIVLEYLITHGPQRAVGEVSSDRDAIEELTRLQFTDERGFDRGSLVRARASRLLQLITESDVLAEERKLAQKISQGIRGFGGSSSGNSAAASNPNFKLEGFGSSLTPRSSSFHDFDSRKGLLLQGDNKKTETKDFANFSNIWNPFKSSTQKKDWNPSESTHVSATDNDDWHPFEEESFGKSGLLQSSPDNQLPTTERKLDQDMDRRRPVGLSRNSGGIQRSFKISERPKAAPPTLSRSQSDIPDLINF